MSACSNSVNNAHTISDFPVSPTKFYQPNKFIKKSIYSSHPRNSNFLFIKFREFQEKIVVSVAASQLKNGRYQLQISKSCKFQYYHICSSTISEPSSFSTVYWKLEELGVLMVKWIEHRTSISMFWVQTPVWSQEIFFKISSFLQLWHHQGPYLVKALSIISV